MQHLICPATGQLALVDSPVPPIGPDEILVQMVACGICGTDLLKVYDATMPKPTPLGHELVGVIAAVGTQVTGFAVGQPVAVAHHVPDYSSHYTRHNSAPMDPLFKATNLEPGGFADYVRVPALHLQHTTLLLPPTLPMMRALFMEPLACCLRALDRVTLYEGDTVLLVGVGAIGLLFVPLLRDRSVTVLAADLRSCQLAKAQAWGTQAGFLATSPELLAGVQSASAGRGVDLVILTVVNQVTLDLALQAVRAGGTILLFGAKPGVVASLDTWQIWRREINLVSSYSATPDLLPRALAILARPTYTLETLISHTFPLHRAAEGFALAQAGNATKVVIARDG